VNGAPAIGNPTANPPATQDPNKWNDTIAGAKGAIWLGVIGFILGGPLGMLTCAMIGFGAGYMVNKISSGD
jgi:hypothetical protein